MKMKTHKICVCVCVYSLKKRKENENTIHLNSWNAAKMILRNKFITPNAYVN